MSLIMVIKLQLIITFQKMIIKTGIGTVNKKDKIIVKGSWIWTIAVSPILVFKYVW